MTTQNYKTATFEEELELHGNLVYTNVGYSMMPLLRQHKDLVEIIRHEPTARCNKYDAVLYKRGDRYILHRILKVTPTGYVIAGDHNFRKEYDITDKQIIGILTAVVRNGKRISVTDRTYQIYVHLWCDFYPIRAFILYAKYLIKSCVKILLGKICRILPIKRLKHIF